MLEKKNKNLVRFACGSRKDPGLAGGTPQTPPERPAIGCTIRRLLPRASGLPQSGGQRTAGRWVGHHACDPGGVASG